jgi:hypothetical protein
MLHSSMARLSGYLDLCTYYSTADDATALISARVTDSPARLPHAVDVEVPTDRSTALPCPVPGTPFSAGVKFCFHSGFMTMETHLGMKILEV